MKKSNAIRVEMLRESNLKAFQVWRYTDFEKSRDVFVRPVKTIPVENLDGKFVATQVVLANGHKVLATIGNVDVNNPLLTRHWLSLSVLCNEKWFHLARYHDFDYKERGPESLANFLKLSVSDVFPISYDLRAYIKGKPESLVGEIEREPKDRLSRAEIISLAVPRKGL